MHSRLAACVLTVPFLLAAASAQTARQTAMEVTATASVAPPQLTFAWPSDATATGYTVSRRAPGDTIWGPLIAVPGGGAATSWVDATVGVGERYEYRFIKSGSPVARGFLTAGVAAAAIEDRGGIVLLVDATKVAALGARLDRLVEDLTGDGWTVLRHDVLPTDSVPGVKAIIAAEAAARPGVVRAVFLLGRVPVPYSGRIFPDGHPDHNGAWPADVYYGELDGTWTDTAVNVTSASRAENRNIPGDGKFDQSSIPSNVDLAVGRVDFANMPAFGVSEEALLQQYLDKDHDYRHKVFAVDQRAVIDDNFGYFSGEAFAASGWRNFSALVGPANVAAADYFTTLNTTTGNGYAWSYGCGGGSYTSAGGIGTTNDFVASANRGVFTVLFGSYFGDWDSTNNFLRAPLCSGWTLSNAWAGRPHWSFHPMALGETLGACTMLSQNDTSVGGFGVRQVHIALMGDPTLRQHVIAPPGGLQVVDQWPAAGLTWTPSADAVDGYHVYRSSSSGGPFVRLTGAPVVAAAYVDPAALQGDSAYMVRAIKLETAPTGTYWNLSQGVFGSQCLPNQPASHTPYGTGCYTISDSFHQSFADPAAASAALNGNSITLLPAAGGYAVSPGGGVFVAPSAGATALALGDDDQVAVSPSQPLLLPGGSTSALHVNSNGIVAAAPLAMSPATSAVPAVATLLAEAASAFYCWHDFDPSAPGSGGVVVEEVAGTLYVTWDGVAGKPQPSAGASSMQLQFELATGVVRYVWSALATTGAGEFLVGWSPGGPSVDAGPVDVLAAPFPVGGQNLLPLQLSASPAPVSTQGSGTLVTYAIDEVPALSPGSYAGLLIFGLARDEVGVDLASLGAPGCTQWLGSLDSAVFLIGGGPSLSGTLQIPAGIPCGSEVFAQAVALITPGSLPNGQNAAGLVTSNGVGSFINGF